LPQERPIERRAARAAGFLKAVVLVESSKRVALVAVLWAACAQAPPPATHVPIHRVAGHEARRVSLTLTDVLGGPVRLGHGQERVAVVVFISKQSRDESAELLRRLDERVLNRPVDSIGVVDVARYSGFTRGIAERRLRQSLVDGRAKRRERRLALGIDASAALVDRWHLIGDFNGAVLDAFGVEREPVHPIAFVVERSGAVRGPYRDLESVLGAIGTKAASRARAAHSDAASPDSSHLHTER
jgi:hypothetical protein